MFEALTDRMQGIFKDLRNRGRLGEPEVDAALKEVRLALLEADVNFRVARDFIKRVRERALGVEVSESLTPAQQVLRIVNEPTAAALGAEDRDKATQAAAKASLWQIWLAEIARDPQLQAIGELQRAAQWRLDFVAAENSMGFHAPQELARILAEAIDLARQAEVKATALAALRR